MKLRNFTAKDMPSAMQQIREALGPNAVILSTQKESGRGRVHVTAAIDDQQGSSAFDDFRDTIELAKSRNQQREWLQQLTRVLEFHRLPDALVSRMKRVSEQVDLNALLTLQKITSKSAKSIVEARTLATILQKCFSFSPVDTFQAGKRLAFIGTVGAGKTITTAKFATQLVMQNQPVSVITLDFERAGGIEQLEAYTNILKVELHRARSKQELLQLIKSIPLSHVTLIDTPGCNPLDHRATDDLLDLISIAGIEPILVLPAGLDSEDSMDIIRGFGHASIQRIIATRLDTSRRFGNILAAAAEAGLAFSHYSDSPNVVDCCHTLDDEQLAKFLLQHTLNEGKPS